jgi:hypothetical protein
MTKDWLHAPAASIMQNKCLISNRSKGLGPDIEYKNLGTLFKIIKN